MIRWLTPITDQALQIECGYLIISIVNMKLYTVINAVLGDTDIINNRCSFRCDIVKLRRNPTINYTHFTFQHKVSETFPMYIFHVIDINSRPHICVNTIYIVTEAPGSTVCISTYENTIDIIMEIYLTKKVSEIRCIITSPWWILWGK